MSSAPLPVRPDTIRMEFEYDGGGLARGGTVKLLVDGKQVGTGRVEKTERRDSRPTRPSTSVATPARP